MFLKVKSVSLTKYVFNFSMWPIKRYIYFYCMNFTDKWTFWLVILDFDSGTAKYTIEEIGKVNTIKNLYQYYHRLPQISEIKRNTGKYASIGFFKGAIKPAWEDSANKNGASHQFRVKEDIVNGVWRNLLLSASSNELNSKLQPQQNNKICGLMVSPKKERGEYAIEIWVSSDEPPNPSFAEYICELVNSADGQLKPTDVRFQPHKNH